MRCWMRRLTHCVEPGTDRVGTWVGTHDRKLPTRADEVSLKIPKLRRQTFETVIIERYRRREASIEESLIKIYLAGYRCAGWRISHRRCGVRRATVAIVGVG